MTTTSATAPAPPPAAPPPIEVETPGEVEELPPPCVLLTGHPLSSAFAEAGFYQQEVLREWWRYDEHGELAAEGRLLGFLDWRRLVVNEAPRGGVVLKVHRQQPQNLEVGPGEWDAEIMPPLPDSLMLSYMTMSAFSAVIVGDDGQDAVGLLGELVGEKGFPRGGNWDLWAEGQAIRWLLASGALDEAERRWNLLQPRLQDAETHWLVWSWVGPLFLDRGRLELAEQHYRRALLEMPPNPLAAAAIHFALGRLAFHRQNLVTALAALDEAVGHLETSAPSSAQLAHALVHRAETLSLTGHFAQAFEEAGRAQSLLERHAPRSEMMVSALTMQSASLAVQQIGLDQATELAERALELADSGGFAHKMPEAHRVLATLQMIQGRLPEATDSSERALDTLSQVPGIAGAALLEVSILGDLGQMELRRGRLARAEDFLQRAWERARTISANPSEGFRILYHLALVNLLQANWRSGDRWLAIGQELLASLPGSPLHAIALQGRGLVAKHEGDVQTARAFFMDALEGSWQEAMDPHLTHQLKGNLADLHLREGETGEALEILRPLLQTVESHNEKGQLAAHLRLLLGEAALIDGRYDDAERWLRAVLSLEHPSPNGRFAAGERLAEVYLRLGQTEAAIEVLETLIGDLERFRGAIGGFQGVLGGPSVEWSSNYHQMIAALLTLGQSRRAFDVLERYRAQSFLRLSWQLAAPTSIDEDESKRLDRLTRRYDELLSQLDDEELKEAERESMELELHQVRAEQRFLLDRRKVLPAQGQRPEVLNSEAIQRLLPEGTLMLSFAVGAEALDLFLLTRERFDVLRLEAQGLETEVERWLAWIGESRKHVSGAAFARQQGTALYQRLLAPAQAWIDAADRLVVVPDGPLHLLPWGALGRKTADGPARYLIEDKPVSLVLSGTVLGRLQKLEPAEPELELLAVGDPWLGETSASVDRPSSVPVLGTDEADDTRGGLMLPALPFSRLEAERVAEPFAVARRLLLLGQDATEESVKSAPASRVLHLAAHGMLDDQDPLDSFLVLAQSEPSAAVVAAGDHASVRDNGRLMTMEVLSEMRLDSELVVLSACESAAGKLTAGEGLIGLTRAFQLAGSPAVVAGLWSVSDVSTSELMVRFHLYLRSGMAKDEALQAAQLELIRQPEEQTLRTWLPYHWAAFQVYGDPRPVDFRASDATP